MAFRCEHPNHEGERAQGPGSRPVGVETKFRQVMFRGFHSKDPEVFCDKIHGSREDCHEAASGGEINLCFPCAAKERVNGTISAEVVEKGKVVRFEVRHKRRRRFAHAEAD